jgi:hypothetical protein
MKFIDSESFENFRELSKYGEILGKGVEKIVFQDSENPNYVMKFYKDRLLDQLGNMDQVNNIMKAHYYFMNILHLLFPEEIPKMAQIGVVKNKEGKQELMTYIKRVELGITHKKINDKKTQGLLIPFEYEKDIRKKVDIKNFYIKMAKLGIKVDDRYWNFNDDGTYLDSIKIFENSMADPIARGTRSINFNRVKLVSAINNLEPRKKERSLKYLERMEFLLGELRKVYVPKLRGYDKKPKKKSVCEF